MTDHVITLHDLRVLVCAPDGPVLRGDVSEHPERSSTFRAFAHETNRGRQLWFATDDAELGARLAGQPAAR